MVFNRYGILVFETRDGTRKWHGATNGIAHPRGTSALIRQPDRPFCLGEAS